MVEIKYVFHDCFVVKTPHCAMIFDYWTDPGSCDKSYPDFLDDLNPDYPLYVFVSHSHKDHFTRKIFNWAARFPKIHYFVSHETALKCRYIMSPTSVYAGPKIKTDQLSELSAGDEWTDEGILIHAFGSTDIGVSWMIEAEGKRFFHAGDFNAWLWRDESTIEEVEKAWNSFVDILADIVKVVAGNPVDYAFFPVDSRIGADWWIGAKTFLESLDVKTLFPMHLGIGDENEQAVRRHDASRFDLYASSTHGRCVLLAMSGDCYAEV